MSNTSKSNLLMRAAGDGDAVEVRRLIPLFSAKVHFNQALVVAARQGHARCVELLIPVSDPKDDNSAALCNAVREGYPDCVKLLIPVSDPKSKNSEALQLAAFCGDSEFVELLIPVSDPKANNSQALGLAVYYGHLKCTELLYPVSDPTAALNTLKHKCPPNTGLLWSNALKPNDCMACYPITLEKGLPIVSIKCDTLVLHQMILNFKGHMSNSNNNLLIIAARDGNVAEVRRLIPISDPKAHDSLPLQLASENGHTEW